MDEELKSWVSWVSIDEEVRWAYLWVWGGRGLKLQVGNCGVGGGGGRGVGGGGDSWYACTVHSKTDR